METVSDDVEGSSGSGVEPKREATGVLLSPSLEHDEWSCVRLVYQIAGSGHLEVLRRSEGRSFDTPLWSSRTPSDSWVIASVDLHNASEPFRVRRRAASNRTSNRTAKHPTLHPTRHPD